MNSEVNGRGRREVTAGAGRPLAGWRVLVPRPAERATPLADALRELGAEPVAVELISIERPEDAAPLDLALVDLAQARYDWVGFTSVNALDAVLRRAAELGLAPVVPASTRVAAVGPATTAALRTAGLPVDLVPGDGGSAAALGECWPSAPGDAAVFLPRSDLAPSGLPHALAAKGYRVDAVTAYRTVVNPVPVAVAAELAAGSFDAVLLTSPSTVAALRAVDVAPSTVLGAIGDPTTRAGANAGRRVHFTANRPTARALADALADFAATHPRPVEA